MSRGASLSRSLPALVAGFALASSGCAAVVAGAVGGAAGGAASVEESRQSDHSAMTYTKTVLANVLYVPAKAVFATVGAATSGLSYIATLGDESVARSIWTSSVGGDYVVTPSMIDGPEEVDFVGSVAPPEDEHPAGS